MKKLIFILLFISFASHAMKVPTQVMESLKKVYPTQDVKWHKNRHGYEAYFKTETTFGSLLMSPTGELLLKIETIELDDAPVLVAEDLKGHDVKSITRVVDYEENTTTYDVQSKLGKHNYTNVYNGTGELEDSRKARNFMGIPIAGGTLLTVAIIVSCIF